MKNCNIIPVIYIFTVAVKGAFWAAATQPILLGIGAAFAALNLDIELNLDKQNADFFILDILSIFKKDKKEVKDTEKNKYHDIADEKGLIDGKPLEYWEKLMAEQYEEEKKMGIERDESGFEISTDDDPKNSKEYHDKIKENFKGE